MKRWIITESEKEKQFLIKNMFFLKKVDGKLFLTATNGEVSIINIDCSTRTILLKRYDFTLILIYKRNNYKINSSYSYRIHYTCFDELREWLKDRVETDYVL